MSSTTSLGDVIVDESSTDEERPTPLELNPAAAYSRAEMSSSEEEEVASGDKIDDLLSARRALFQQVHSHSNASGATESADTNVSSQHRSSEHFSDDESFEELSMMITDSVESKKVLLSTARSAPQIPMRPRHCCLLEATTS